MDVPGVEVAAAARVLKRRLSNVGTRPSVLDGI